MHRIVLGVALLLYGQVAGAAPATLLVQSAGLVPYDTVQPAADFTLPDHQGNTVRLQEQRGKVVFLNFWATWCPPCRHEMPGMEQLFQALRQRPFVMWAIAMQEEREQVVPFLAANGLHFPALLDLDGAVSARYAVKGLPTTYVIDCGGRLVGRAVGPREWSTPVVQTLMATLLDDTHCR